MVATDAIGMGLNMDVNHVAFSGLRKFDGRHTRMLSPVEVGQIAGRAGRHMNDGSFGTTAGHGPLPPSSSKPSKPTVSIRYARSIGEAATSISGPQSDAPKPRTKAGAH